MHNKQKGEFIWLTPYFNSEGFAEITTKEPYLILMGQTLNSRSPIPLTIHGASNIVLPNSEDTNQKYIDMLSDEGGSLYTLNLGDISVSNFNNNMLRNGKTVLSDAFIRVMVYRYFDKTD